MGSAQEGGDSIDFGYFCIPALAHPRGGPDNGDMRILGIETSCDDTGVAVFDTERGLLAHKLYSQSAMHAEYGGVVPELASRDHIRKLLPLVREVLADAGIASGDLGGVAYTMGPGLEIGRASCRERV